MTTKIYIDPKHWSNEYGKLKSNTNDAKSINKMLDGFRMKAFDYQRQLMDEGKPVTIANMRLKWFGKSLKRPRMLMEIFESKKHTESFMMWKYKVKDIDIKALKYEFLADYEFWLKTERKCDHNTTVKYLSNFKKIVNICIKNGWLEIGRAHV